MAAPFDVMISMSINKSRMTFGGMKIYREEFRIKKAPGKKEVKTPELTHSVESA
jgi:hypothetical protein